MIIPVRCFSCGRVIGSDYVKFVNKMNEIRKSQNREPLPEEIAKTLDDLNVTRYCCRRMILSNADLLEEILPFD
ncbi:MAG: DNA-directed RNA polymerase subunit N [Thermoplasmatales archaeon]